LTLVAIAVLVSPPEIAHGQQAITLDVAVRDGSGRFVTGLRAENFEIRDDGQTRAVGELSVEVLPVSILVLVDDSASIRARTPRDNIVPEIQASVSSFLRGLDEKDVARVGLFSEDLRVDAGFASDAEVLVNIIESMRPSGWTHLYDAVIEALERLAPVSGRKALVLLSDGEDSRAVGSGSVSTRKDTIEAVRRSDALVYTVGVKGRSHPEARGMDKGFLRDLARQSGGLALVSGDISELDAELTLIQEDLHALYRLSYIPSESTTEGDWHRIDARIKGRRDLTVRTKAGHYPAGEARERWH